MPCQCLAGAFKRKNKQSTNKVRILDYIVMNTMLLPFLTLTNLAKGLFANDQLTNLCLMPPRASMHTTLGNSQIIESLYSIQRQPPL
eukprot:scaffold16454_cov72-Cyclotella_meneghiniana.AAC.1